MVRDLRGVLERAEHARQVPQRRSRCPPFRKGARGLAFEVDHREAGCRPQQLAEVVVTMDPGDTRAVSRLDRSELGADARRDGPQSRTGLAVHRRQRAIQLTLRSGAPGGQLRAGRRSRREVGGLGTRGERRVQLRGQGADLGDASHRRGLSSWRAGQAVQGPAPPVALRRDELLQHGGRAWLTPIGEVGDGPAERRDMRKADGAEKGVDFDLRVRARLQQAVDLQDEAIAERDRRVRLLHAKASFLKVADGRRSTGEDLAERGRRLELEPPTGATQLAPGRNQTGKELPDALAVAWLPKAGVVGNSGDQVVALSARGVGGGEHQQPGTRARERRGVAQFDTSQASRLAAEPALIREPLR